jgi:tRNA threonylcarbamoyladenosine biosynthesis protein TsaB
MSLLLAIDTSGRNCRVGLADEGRLLVRRIGENSRQAAQEVLPLIKDVMAEGRLELRELDALAVISGPGSFTGLRIGIGVAQALSFTQSIPIVAVSSLALQAWCGMKQQGVLECLVFEEAKEPEFYFAHYRCDPVHGTQLLGKEQVGAMEDLQIPASFTSLSQLPKHAGLLGSVCATVSALGQVAGGVPAYPELIPGLEEFCELATIKFHHNEVSKEPVLPNYVKEQMEYS